MGKKYFTYDPFDPEGPEANSLDLQYAGIGSSEQLVEGVSPSETVKFTPKTNGTNQTTNSSNKTTSSSANKTSGGYVKPEWMSDAAFADITAKRDAMSDPYVAGAFAGLEELESKIKNPTYLETMESIIAEYEGRDKFSYDYSTDPMFQNMMAGYKAQGQLAMENAMAEAAGLTGGYASSWSQSAGQQAFDQYLQKGYDNLPAYYQMALDAYNQEGADILKRYEMYSALDERERQMLADQLGIKKAELDFYLENYNKQFDDKQARGSYFAGIDQSEFSSEEQQEQDYIDQLASQLGAAYEKGTFEEFIASLPSGVVGSDAFQQALWANGLTANSKDKASNSDSKNSYSSAITSKLATITRNDELEAFLNDLQESGLITSKQKDEYYSIYKKPDEKGLWERDWVDLVETGGVNWGWGDENYDEDAKVRDQYGNEYTGTELYAALRKEGYSESEAKKKAKIIITRLGG